jgi:hypothetical protein
MTSHSASKRIGAIALCSAIAMAGAVLVPGVAGAANPVANGSFESAVNPGTQGAFCLPVASTVGNWTRVSSLGAPLPTVVTSPKKSGKLAGQFYRNTNQGQPDQPTGFLQSFSSVSATKKFKMSAWFYRVAGRGGLTLYLTGTYCTAPFDTFHLDVDVNQTVAYGAGGITATAPGIGTNAWHKVTLSYSYKTHRVTLQIDGGPKVTSAVGPATAGYTGPAQLFFGQSSTGGSVPLQHVVVDKVKFSAK